MNNPFARFYNCSVEILALHESGPYTKVREWKQLGVIKADIQPYSGGLADEEYGLKEDCQLRMFCDPCDDVKTGNYILYGNKRYRITYTAAWQFGLEVLLSEYIGQD